MIKVARGKCVVAIDNSDNEIKCGHVLKKRAADLEFEPGLYLKVSYEADQQQVAQPAKPVKRAETIPWHRIISIRFDNAEDDPFGEPSAKRPAKDDKPKG